MTRAVVVFVHTLYEELELHYPRLRFQEAGYRVWVAGPEKGAIYAGKHGYPCQADLSFEEVDPKACEGVIIPGGYAPDKLRREEKALTLVRTLHQEKKMVAYVCHAGWVPISARIVNGFRCTSTPAIRDDLVNAGGIWEDAPVVVDRHHISSRYPQDLPAFCKAMLHFLEPTTITMES